MATRTEYQEALRLLKAKETLTPSEEQLVVRLEQKLKAKPRAKKAAK